MKKLLIVILMLSLTIGMLSAQMRAAVPHEAERVVNALPQSSVGNSIRSEKGILFGASSFDERNIQFSHTVSNILEDAWQNGEFLQGVEAMQRFTPAQIAAFGLQGHNLSKVIFVGGNGSDHTYTIKVYTGGSGGTGGATLNPGTLVHEQLVTSYTPNSGYNAPAIWTEIELTTEIPIPSDQELWLGWHVVQGPVGQGPAPVTDYGNGFDGHGYIIWTPSGGWQNGQFWGGYNENWMLRGFAVMGGPSGTLTGTVTSGGSPLAEAEVTIEELGRTTLTNAQGVYTMNNVAVGTYSVTASKFGYLPATNNGVVITDGNTTTSNFTLAASSTVAVSGVIKGSDTMQGLNGANITLTGITDYATTSNASGSFTIPGVYPGYTYHLKVTRDGYMAYDDPNIEVGTSNLDLGDIVMFEIIKPPRDLKVEIVNHKAELEWLPPRFIGEPLWFSQTPAEVANDGIGTNGVSMLIAAHRYTQEQMAVLGISGSTLSKVAFIPYQSSISQVTIRIYQGGSASPWNPGTEIYSQSVPPPYTPEVWNEVELNEDVPIPTTGEFWIGVQYNNSGGYPMGVDAGPHNHAFGNVTYDGTFDMTWGTLVDLNPQLTYNWMIKGFTEDANPPAAFGHGLPDDHDMIPGADTRALEGYNVYRTNSVNLGNPTEWKRIAENLPLGSGDEDTPVYYTDAQFPALDPGQYYYIVKAVYTNGHESDGAVSDRITKIDPALAPPELLTGTYIRPDQVELNWISPSSEATGYRILRDGVELVANQTATSYLDTGLAEGQYTYEVSAIYNIGESFPAEVVVDVTISDEGDNPVSMTALRANYPNPFNPSTTIAFDIKEAGVVQIDIFNIRGQKVKTLVHEHMDMGRYTAVWTGIDDNGRNVSSGMYFYQMRAEGFSEIKRMVLMK